MTQSQFMYELMKELDGMSDEQKYDIMNAYTGLFSEQTERGISEQEIVDMLHSPKEIADSYLNGTPVPLDLFISQNENRQSKHKNILKFIMLMPCAVIYVPVTAMIGAALVLLSVILCTVSIAVSVYSFSAAHLSFGFIIIGAGGIIFTFSFVMLCVIFVRLTGMMVTYFPKYMSRVLNNTDRSVKKT